MKKNLIWLLLISLLTITVLYFINQKVNSKSITDEIEIVAILPLSGEYAQYGENDKKGMELAIKDLRMTNMKVTYLDNKGTAKDAVSAFNKIIPKKPLVVIDNAISTITESIIPLSKKHEIPIISTGASNPSFSGISPYFFRIWNSDSEEGGFAAKSCKERLNFSNVNIVNLDNAYGKGLSEVFDNECRKNGLGVKLKIPIPEKTDNYNNYVSKILNTDPIYFVGYGVDLAKFVKSLREQNKQNKIISTVATEDKQVFDIAGNLMNGVYYVYNVEVDNLVYQNFKKSYKELYNEDPQILTDVGYDVILIIKKAIEKGVKTPNEFKVFLNNMEEIDGASGNILFDRNGDVHKKMILKQINNRKFETVQ